MATTENALVRYALEHRGLLPSSDEGLAAAAAYFPRGEVLTDAWGNPFEYRSPGTHGDHPFEIMSLGADGRWGGDGVDADIRSWDDDW